MTEIQISAPDNRNEFEAYFHLRWQLLREPWGQPRGSEQDEYDKTAYHLLARDQQQVVGVGRLHRVDPKTVQIRYMAVHEAFQRQGIGRRILEALEHRARDMDCQSIILDAREQAVGFYLNQAYEIAGEGHTLYGEIRHQKMCKQI